MPAEVLQVVVSEVGKVGEYPVYPDLIEKQRKERGKAVDACGQVISAKGIRVNLQAASLRQRH